jgi:6-methylsalicylate decarboxylase
MTIEVPHDTTRCITSLLLSGGFARWREIRRLFSHAGGTIPMMAGRIDAFYGKRPNLKAFAPEGIIGELQRLNYDTANAINVPTMAALTKLVPESQITYGTDYPYFDLGQFKGGLKWGQGLIGPDDLDSKLLIGGIRQHIDHEDITAQEFVLRLDFRGIPRAAAIRGIGGC